MFQRSHRKPESLRVRQAAQDSLDTRGLTAAVTPRIVYAENIAQSLQFCAKRKRGCGVLRALPVINDKTNAYIIVPENLHSH